MLDIVRAIMGVVVFVGLAAAVVVLDTGGWSSSRVATA